MTALEHVSASIAIAASEIAAAITATNADADMDPAPAIAATKSGIAAMRIMQLIPYTGLPFTDKWQNWADPIAWALCADGQVRLVVNDIQGRHLVVVEVSEETTNFWGDDD